MLARDPDRLPEDPRPALVREVRRRHGLADRDLDQRHQRLRRAGIQNPAYAGNDFGDLGAPADPAARLSRKRAVLSRPLGQTSSGAVALNAASTRRWATCHAPRHRTLSVSPSCSAARCRAARGCPLARGRGAGPARTPPVELGVGPASQPRLGEPSPATHRPGTGKARRRLGAGVAPRAAARPRRRRLQPSSSSPHSPLYWGASIGDQLTGDQAPWDMSAVSKFEEWPASRSRWSTSSPRSPTAPARRAPSTSSPPSRWKASARTARSRSSAGARSRSPSRPRRARLPALRRDRRHLRLLHPRIRRRRQGLGPPLLPPLQLGDERQLVPLVGGRQRQPAGRIRRRLAPRPRHLHRGRRDQRDLGLVPERRPRGNAADLASLYPGDEYVDWTGLDGYNWGTNPAKPDGWTSFDQLFSSTYDADHRARSPPRSR